jgi:hypothetical protein
VNFSSQFFTAKPLARRKPRLAHIKAPGGVTVDAMAADPLGGGLETIAVWMDFQIFLRQEGHRDA